MTRIKPPVRTRTAAFLAAVSVSLLALAGCSGTNAGGAPTSSASDGPPIPLKVTIVPGALTTLPIAVGIEMKYFAKNGLAPETVNSASGTTNTQLLASGQLDIAALDISGTVLANQAGASLVIATGMSNRFPAALVCRQGLGVAKGYPDGVKSLVGKTIGITGPGSGSETYTRALFEAAGLQPSSANLVALGGLPQMTAALQANRVDCAMLFQPAQTQLEGKVDVIIDIQGGKGPDLINNSAFSVLAMSKAGAAKNPMMVSRLQAALHEIDALLADPANAEAVATGVAASYPGVDHATLVRLLQGLAPSFKDGDVVTKDQFDATLKMYDAAYGKSLDVAYSDVVLPVTR